MDSTGIAGRPPLDPARSLPRGSPPRGSPPRGSPPRGSPPRGSPPRGSLPDSLFATTKLSIPMAEIDSVPYMDGEGAIWRTIMGVGVGMAGAGLAAILLEAADNQAMARVRRLVTAGCCHGHRRSSPVES